MDTTMFEHLREEEEEEEEMPWYRDPNQAHPFNLTRKISQERADAPAFRTVAMFPWNVDSLSNLWSGTLNTVDHLEPWKNMISEYWDAVAVGSASHLYVFFTHKKKAPLCVKLPDEKLTKGEKSSLIDADVMCVAWGLSPNAPLEPVIYFSRGSVLYVYNIGRMGIAGYIRGHGGVITSIAVHPTRADLFCTTSRDLTTRIYDLKLDAKLGKLEKKGKKKKNDKVPNPHWPPNKTPSLAGAAHGLRLPHSDHEGTGAGRCIVVLMGGRSGGHQAPVLGAAFHPTYPLVATCGMDRCVKIWVVRPANDREIKREDKPLFTSSRVHKARVLSISWLQDDLLLTHSAPAIMKKRPLDPKSKSTYIEPGELIIWRWLSVDRFFPPRPGQEDDPVPLSTIRGCSADYQESSSFKLISVHRFPDATDQYQVPNMSLFKSPTHDPIALFVYPGASDLVMLNLSHLSPRKRPPFPAEHLKDGNDTGLAGATQQMHIGGEDDDEEEQEEKDDDDEDQEDGEQSDGSKEEDDERKRIEQQPAVLSVRSQVIPPPLTGWQLGINDEGKTIHSCVMGVGGRMIVAVGSKGSLWVWRSDLAPS